MNDTKNRTIVLDGSVEMLLSGGLGRISSAYGAVLLPQVVAGDVVRCELVEKKRGVWHGKVLEVLQPSPQRCSAPCPMADVCGGCALQMVESSSQSSIKSAWVRQSFAKMWREDTAWMPIVTDRESRRRRVRWHINATGAIGFHARNSNTLITIAHCPVLTAPLNALLSLWTKLQQQLLAASLPMPTSLYAVQVDNGIHAVLEYAVLPDTKPSLLDQVLTANDTPLQWWWRDHHGCRALHKPLLHLQDIVPAGEYDLLLDVGPDDFVQADMVGNQLMVHQIQQWCKGKKRVVDLFCGIGNLSLPLAVLGAEIRGFEMNPASVRAANATAKRLKLQARYAQADLMGRTDIEGMVGADCLILDPPRKGAKRICQQMHRLLPCSIIMIHCDPASAARDASIVHDQGFHLVAVRALDLFPFSGHVESMSYWQRS